MAPFFLDHPVNVVLLLPDGWCQQNVVTVIIVIIPSVKKSENPSRPAGLQLFSKLLASKERAFRDIDLLQCGPPMKTLWKSVNVWRSITKMWNLATHFTWVTKCSIFWARFCRPWSYFQTKQFLLTMTPKVATNFTHTFLFNEYPLIKRRQDRPRLVLPVNPSLYTSELYSEIYSTYF